MRTCGIICYGALDDYCTRYSHRLSRQHARSIRSPPSTIEVLSFECKYKFRQLEPKSIHHPFVLHSQPLPPNFTFFSFARLFFFFLPLFYLLTSALFFCSLSVQNTRFHKLIMPAANPKAKAAGAEKPARKSAL